MVYSRVVLSCDEPSHGAPTAGVGQPHPQTVEEISWPTPPPRLQAKIWSVGGTHPQRCVFVTRSAQYIKQTHLQPPVFNLILFYILAKGNKYLRSKHTIKLDEKTTNFSKMKTEKIISNNWPVSWVPHPSPHPVSACTPVRPWLAPTLSPHALQVTNLKPQETLVLYS